jgi:hypothetical protein
MAALAVRGLAQQLQAQEFFMLVAVVLAVQGVSHLTDSPVLVVLAAVMVEPKVMRLLEMLLLVETLLPIPALEAVVVVLVIQITPLVVLTVVLAALASLLFATHKSIQPPR